MSDMSRRDAQIKVPGPKNLKFTHHRVQFSDLVRIQTLGLDNMKINKGTWMSSNVV